MRPALAAAVPFALAAVALAQDPARAARTPRFATVVKAGPQEVVSCMTSYQRSFAPGPDGSMFVLIAHCAWPDAERKQTPVRTLQLWRSEDGCLTWRHAATVPCKVAGDGALVAHDRGKRFSVAWSGAQDADWASAWHQEFDVVAGKFLGEPVELARGSGEEKQYNVYDLDLGSDGTLVATIGNHRQTEAPWTCGWSTGLRWRRPGAPAWEPLVQVNPGDYGIWGQVQVFDAQAHITYRTRGWDPILALRTFDCAKGAFTSDTELGVTPPPVDGIQVANGSLGCADRVGNLWVAYTTGRSDAGGGRLKIAFARKDKLGEWLQLDVGEDPPLQGGNYNYAHFTISHGPGNQVIVFWSRAADDYSTLYQRVFDDGHAIGEARLLHQGAANEFQVLTGHRSLAFLTGLQLVVRSAPATAPDGEVRVFGLLPAKTVWAR